MWIFMNDSFVSIVAHRDKDGVLLVRTREEEDLYNFLGHDPSIKERAFEGIGSDYRWRIEATVEEVDAALAERVYGINYTNFKASVRDNDRHDAYMGVWMTMARWGDRALQAISGFRWQRTLNLEPQQATVEDDWINADDLEFVDESGFRTEVVHRGKGK